LLNPSRVSSRSRKRTSSVLLKKPEGSSGLSIPMMSTGLSLPGCRASSQAISWGSLGSLSSRAAASATLGRYRPQGVGGRSISLLPSSPGHVSRCDAVGEEGADHRAGTGADVDVDVVDAATHQHVVERTQRADLVGQAGDAPAAEHQRPFATGRIRGDGPAGRRTPAAGHGEDYRPRGLPGLEWRSVPSKPLDLIRNFCIIAHIDHGKSTLADRLLERTGTVAMRDMQDQLLDTLDLERERGITIKAQAVRLDHAAADGLTYQLNLIDTPGHVDFAYEVSRSLAACEGALLVVDASQGIEAQTLANVYAALEADLEVIPVINKIDLPAADPELVRQEIEDVIGLPGDGALLASARQGIGIDAILEAIVSRVPPPSGEVGAPLQALIFDSKYDAYRGVIVYVRVMHGVIRQGQRIRMMATGKDFVVDEVGVFRPQPTSMRSLSPGEVGYVVASIKDVRDSKVGDTVTDADNAADHPLPGYRTVTPMVFAGIFPIDSDNVQELKEALSKLNLNDASLVYEPESSVALGFGFRCGFLGLLHMEIVQERLEREFDLELLTTAPTVEYRVRLRSGEMVAVDNPAMLPDPANIDAIEEPRTRATIFVPKEYVGPLMELCQERRGELLDMQYQPGDRVALVYDLPLGEIIHDFYDQLKSRSRGYASLDYEITGFRAEKLVKLDILVGGQRVDALSMIVHRDKAPLQGRKLAERLRKLIPRQLFEVAIQAAIGGKIVARETVSAMRKDVLAKCYGGDITRKRKLLEKQKEGKKRMKRVGNVEIPQEAFMAVLKLDE
jgi:GTP-binding protein LepA